MKNILCIPAIILLIPVAVAACACWCVVMLGIVVAISPLVLASKVMA